MSFQIAGLGTAKPPYEIRQNDAAQIAKTFCCDSPQHEKLMQTIYLRTGIQARGSVLLDNAEGELDQRQTFFTDRTSPTDCGPGTGERMDAYKEWAGKIAKDACQKALAAAGWQPREITHLVTVSCSGFVAPGFDLELFAEMPLRAECARTHLGFMGCHGALNGLRVAQAFVQADPQAKVLLCAVELCTLHHQYGWNPERIVANALFADGGAAVAGCHIARAASTGWTIGGQGSLVLADSGDAMGWRIGDNGFEMSLSPRVPEMIQQHLKPWVTEWLARYDLSIDQVPSWGVHPGGPRILRATAEALDLTPAQIAASEETLQAHGNMSSPTLLFILDRLQQQGGKPPCVLLGFGPGLTIEATLLR